MKKKMPCGKTIILSIVAIVLLVVGIYAMTRPMSYGTNYYHASFYEGTDFSGSMTFFPDNTMLIRNTNFEEELTCFYYYKNGYVFFTLAETEAELAAINQDFEAAVNSPFYASKINAFRLTSEGLDGYTSVYLCQSSVTMAVILGAIELALIGFAIAPVIRRKKEYSKNKQEI